MKFIQLKLPNVLFRWMDKEVFLNFDMYPGFISDTGSFAVHQWSLFVEVTLSQKSSCCGIFFIAHLFAYFGSIKTIDPWKVNFSLSIEKK